PARRRRLPSPRRTLSAITSPSAPRRSPPARSLLTDKPPLFWKREELWERGTGYETDKIPHPHLRRTAHGACGPDRHPGRVAGKPAGGGEQLRLPGPAGLLRHHPGGGGDPGDDGPGKAPEQGVHHRRDRRGAG